MTLSVDAVSHATATAAGANTLTWSHTCAASANKLVVEFTSAAGILADRTASGATYNGVAMTSKGAADDGNFERVEQWELNSPTTGANNVVVSFGTGTGIQISGGGISFIDAHATSGTASTNTNTTTNPSVTVADSASGDIVVSVVATDNATGTTTEAGTLVWEDEDVASDSDFSCQRQAASGANTVCSWTNSGSGDGWAVHGFAVKPAAGGGSAESASTAHLD